MKKFIVNGQYNQLLMQNHFDVRKVLRAARLPENLFTREQIRLEEPEYYAVIFSFKWRLLHYNNWCYHNPITKLSFVVSTTSIVIVFN